MSAKLTRRDAFWDIISYFIVFFGFWEFSEHIYCSFDSFIFHSFKGGDDFSVSSNYYLTYFNEILPKLFVDLFSD